MVFLSQCSGFDFSGGCLAPEQLLSQLVWRQSIFVGAMSSGTEMKRCFMGVVVGAMAPKSETIETLFILNVELGCLSVFDFT